LWLNRTLWGITWQYTLLEKKKTIVQRRRDFSLSLSSPSLVARNMKVES